MLCVNSLRENNNTALTIYLQINVSVWETVQHDERNVPGFTETVIFFFPILAMMIEKYLQCPPRLFLKLSTFVDISFYSIMF